MNVLRLLEDESLSRTLAYNAREELQRYTWSTVREEWLKIYSSLAGRSSQAAV